MKVRCEHTTAILATVVTIVHCSCCSTSMLRATSDDAIVEEVFLEELMLYLMQLEVSLNLADVLRQQYYRVFLVERVEVRCLRLWVQFLLLLQLVFFKIVSCEWLLLLGGCPSREVEGDGRGRNVVRCRGTGGLFGVFREVKFVEEISHHSHVDAHLRAV